MAYQKSELYFIVALIIGVSVLVFLILQPFLYPLILAVILATVFAPIHKKSLVLARGKRGLAALLSTAFVLIVIIVPVTFLGTQIFGEATQLYSTLSSDSVSGGISSGLHEVARISGINFFTPESFDIGQYMKNGLGWLVQHLGTIFSNVAMVFVDIFILLVALHALFKDGDKLKKSIISLSPLKDIHDETIFCKLQQAINGVVMGSISVGIIQGVLTAIGLTIFGVPNAVLLGSLAALGALIPGVGTSLVIIPSILFLFFIGEHTSAAGLLAWGVLGVGLVDNYLGPKLVSHGVKLHPFIVLLSVFGGVSLFGAPGVLFGPLVLSMLPVFLEIHTAVREENNNAICK